MQKYIFSNNFWAKEAETIRTPSSSARREASKYMHSARQGHMVAKIGHAYR